ncbi:MAG: hypothetical protein BWZ09_01917 [Alphaproteobacteria bacterium ADurb.BinA305]|nr:MAG: hypothetical protein BWZ09_01917 [Alphaproteobacteria bacterium ADurb.BinA305]
MTHCPDCVWLVECGEDVAGDQGCLFARLGCGVAQILQHHHELVSTEARHGVALAHHLAQARRDLAQQLVAGLVAVGVVYALEVVDIDEQQRPVAAVAARVGQALAQAVEQETAVGELGQRVDEGEIADRFLGGLAFGDVDDHPVEPERFIIGVDRHAAALADPMDAPVAPAHAVFHLVVGVTDACALDRGDDRGDVLMQDEVSERQSTGHEILGCRPGERGDPAADVHHPPGRFDLAAEDDAGHVLDQGAELVAAVRQVRRGGTHAAAVAGVAVHHREQHQAESAATVEDQGGFRARVVGLEGRRAAEADHPFAPCDLDRVGDDVVRGGIALGRGVEQGLRRFVQVVQFDVGVAQVVAEDGLHHVVRAERRVDVAQQGGAALLHARDRHGLRVHGQVDQEAGLHLGAELLNQGDPAAERGHSRVARAFHGLAAHRLGIHVVAEGAPVAPVEGLQVDDAAVAVAIPGRMYRVVGEAFGAHRRDVGLQLRREQHEGEAGALDTGQRALEVEGCDIGRPLGPADVVARGEQRGAAMQHLLVGLHAREQVVAGQRGVRGEAVARPLLEMGVDVSPQHRRQEQAQDEREPGGRAAVEHGGGANLRGSCVLRHGREG